MYYFNNLKVNTKLILLILVAFVSLSIVGGVGYYYIQEANSQMTIMYQERFVPNDQISGILTNIRTNNSYILEMMLTTDEKKNQELKQSIMDGREQTNNIFALIEKMPMGSKRSKMIS